jgi:hypothetical protein
MSPSGVISAILTVVRLLPVFPQLQTGRCTAITDAMGHCRTQVLQQMTSLFDHLVGADKQRWRDGEAERPCGVEVYHKLKFRRLLDG